MSIVSEGHSNNSDGANRTGAFTQSAVLGPQGRPRSIPEKPDVSVEVVYVTPEIAAQFLGKGQWMLIVRGLEDDIFEVIGCGTVRTIHERLRSDRKETQISASMLRILGMEGRVHEYHVQLVIDSFRMSYDQLRGLKLMNKNNRTTSASILAAAAIRITQYSGSGALPFVLDNVRRLCDADLQAAPPIVISFYKQLMEGAVSKGGGSASQGDLFCRAWETFDPTKSKHAKVSIRDKSVIIKSALAEFHAATQGIFE